jgi:hypothetical protein
MRNDDMQGTGAVTTAGLLSGLINRGESPENLKDQRIMIAGAGEAVLAAMARRCWARAAGARAGGARTQGCASLRLQAGALGCRTSSWQRARPDDAVRRAVSSGLDVSAGAGSAGIGVATAILLALTKQGLRCALRMPAQARPSMRVLARALMLSLG